MNINSQAERQSSHRTLFKRVFPDDQVEAIRTTTLSGLALGNERFKREIEALCARSVSAGEP
jgi:putative transposase